MNVMNFESIDKKTQSDSWLIKADPIEGLYTFWVVSDPLKDRLKSEKNLKYRIEALKERHPGAWRALDYRREVLFDTDQILDKISIRTMVSRPNVLGEEARKQLIKQFWSHSGKND